ncbi:MAG: hypothetical protein ACLRL6_06835 [Clostridium sp.]
MEFAVLSGSDSLILKALKLGAKGVAATSNLLTILMWLSLDILNKKLAEAQMMRERSSLCVRC